MTCVFIETHIGVKPENVISVNTTFLVFFMNKNLIFYNNVTQ